MNDEQQYPKCNSLNTYQDMILWVCLDCSHEWDPSELSQPTIEAVALATVCDVNGNQLVDGDSVTVIKDLNVKGSSSGIKVGTRVKNINIIAPHNGHNISCKIEGIGAMYLKSEFVKKA
jgi:protein PhnA